MLKTPSTAKQGSIISGRGNVAKGGGGTPHKISISLKTDAKRVVEIPLDHDNDRIAVHSSMVEHGEQKIHTQVFTVKNRETLVSEPYETFS
jgi:hypothetical protein